MQTSARQAEESPKTVLVIEDSPMQAMALVRLLANQGLNVLCASNGLAGLAMAQQNLPDAIVLDIQMPELDGLETCQRLKQEARTANIPVILLTALDKNEAMRAGFNLGAADFILKDGFSDVVLLETLRQLHVLAAGNPKPLPSAKDAE